MKLSEAGEAKERERFEAWASEPIRADKLPLVRHIEDDGYVDHRTYLAWYAWKARAVQAVEPEMCKIGHLIATQDNRITDAPIFIVQQKQKTYGVSEDYTDLYDWCHKDGEGTADETLAARLEAKDRQGKSTGKWAKICYVELWEFVTACFTEQGCIDYLKRNGHNLRETRIYADGSFRNEEFRNVREFLKEMAA